VDLGKLRQGLVQCSFAEEWSAIPKMGKQKQQCRNHTTKHLVAKYFKFDFKIYEKIS
jgi:hypothetical protein